MQSIYSRIQKDINTSKTSEIKTGMYHALAGNTCYPNRYLLLYNKNIIIKIIKKQYKKYNKLA
jgi:hypothetical protein